LGQFVPLLDLVIKEGSVVFPGRMIQKADVGVKNGKIVRLATSLDKEPADRIISARGRVVFPGLIDSHFHVGIYRPLNNDAYSESSSAVAGGVTTLLSYFRSGRNYLNTSAPYNSLFSQVLDLSSGNFFCDYGYHLAPITRTHVEEIPELISKFGVSSFKYYMFYKGLTLKGESKKGSVEKEYLLSDDPYDLGHLYVLMQTIAKASKKRKGLRLGIHAEDAELIRLHAEQVKREYPENGMTPLEAYCAARPPIAERMAILEAANLAYQTECPLTILHISSKLSLSTIREFRITHPSMDLMAETTVHHLALTTHSSGVEGKVNPPIRTASDKAALWQGVSRGEISTIVSDHAAITRRQKGRKIWSAEAGFGGTELILPVIVTEGHRKRGVPLEQLAALVSLNPARYYGLLPRKGDIAIGYDADLTIVNVSEDRIVDHSKLHSAQDFSPFDGLRLYGWAETTIVRGNVVYEDGQVVGEPTGEYIRRPVSAGSRNEYR